jgi:hypothetical protein
MTERYGPEDGSLPSWEAPPGSPPSGRPNWTPAGPPSPGGAAAPPPPGNHPIPPPGGAPPRPPGSASTPPQPGGPSRGMPTYRSWQPGFMPLRPLNLGDFLSLPVKAISANRQVILGGPLLCTVISMLVISGAVTLFVIDQQDYFRYTYGDFKPLSGETIAAIIVAIVAYIATDAAARTLIIPGISRAILGERITLGRAWALSRPRIAQVLLLYLLITIGAGTVVLALVGLSYSGAAALVVLLVLALIPAGLYLSVLAGVAVSALVLERLSAPAALSRAHSLMKGNAWRLIGSFLVVSIVLYFVNSAVSTVTEVVVIGVSAAGISLAAIIIVFILFVIITTVVSSMIGYSFLGSVLTLMYVDLRIRNEGFDVDLARAAEAASGR